MTAHRTYRPTANEGRVRFVNDVGQTPEEAAAERAAAHANNFFWVGECEVCTIRISMAIHDVPDGKSPPEDDWATPCPVGHGQIRMRIVGLETYTHFNAQREEDVE